MNDKHFTSPMSRRAMLRIGGAGMLGLSMRHWLQAETIAHHRPRAKSVIFLFQWGGPSQIDMFDMKPDAPDGIRSPYRAISSSVPGMPVCEHLPRLAQRMDKVSIVRTMTHEDEKPRVSRLLRDHRTRPAVRRPAASRLVEPLSGLWQRRRSV